MATVLRSMPQAARGAVLHVDFVRNLCWHRRRCVGPVSRMVAGSYSLSGGLVKDGSNQPYIDLSAFPAILTSGFYGRLLVDCTEASHAFFGMLLHIGDGTGATKALEIYENNDNGWYLESKETDAAGVQAGAYAQAEVEFVFGFGDDFANLGLDGVFPTADTSCDLPSGTYNVLSPGWQYHANELHQPCTFKELTLYEGNPSAAILASLVQS